MTDYQTQIWDKFREEVKGFMEVNNYEGALDRLATAEVTFQLNHQPMPAYKLKNKILNK